ncbi:MAG: hypothetical protein V4457_12670 [Pseudomonadota bacterium]
MKWFNGLAGTSLLLAGSLVQAQGIGYDQVDLSYRVMDRDRADTLDDKFDGPAVRFSMGITDSIYGVIENAYLKSHGPDVDVADLAVGLGYRQALAPDMDFIGEAAWMRRDIDAPSRVDDRKDDGYQLAAGVRYLAMEMLELNLTALYRGGILNDNEAILRAGGVWSVYGPLGVQASAAVSADATIYDLGLRVSF